MTGLHKEKSLERDTHTCILDHNSPRSIAARLKKELSKENNQFKTQIHKIARLNKGRIKSANARNALKELLTEHIGQVTTNTKDSTINHVLSTLEKDISKLFRDVKRELNKEYSELENLELHQ